MLKNTKVVIFDFDGTLTKNDQKGTNCWSRIWEEIDDVETDFKFFSMFERKEIDNDKWLELILGRYKEKGVNKEMLSKVGQKFRLIGGIFECFSFLKEKGIKIYVLSGGIRQLIENALGEIGVFLESIEAYDFVFSKDGSLRAICSPFHNLENKEEFVKFVLEKEKVAANEVLFVGNGKNDEDAYKSGARTLCINPDDANFGNKEIWHNAIIKCDNLKEILKFV